MNESQLRRRAKKAGYRFYRSNWRKDTIDNRGGYRLIDTSFNVVVDGDKFQCSLEDIEHRLNALNAMATAA